MALQNNDQYIGQLLLREGIINIAELEKGLAEQKKEQGFLCSNLVRLGFASEEKIFSILSLQIGVPFVALSQMNIDPVVLNRIPGNFAQACNCMPLKSVDDCLYIAMSDPLNTKATKEIKSYLAVGKLKVFLAGENDIKRAIHKYYGV